MEQKKWLYNKKIYEQDDPLYKRWNETTAMCYQNKTDCSKCFNNKFCEINKINNNPYRIRQIKYATLMTYANLGEEGLERFL